MFLIAASLLLLGVIAMQNYLTPALRNQTISNGLYTSVPTFWALDAAYVVLCTALVHTFYGVNLESEVLSIATAFCLLTTAFTNTCSAWVDKVTGGLHSKLHTYFTAGMFLCVLTLEILNDFGYMIYLTIASVLVPLTVGYIMVKLQTKLLGGPVAEKLAVFGLCSWLIAWSLT